jgi:hypothetical protein
MCSKLILLTGAALAVSPACAQDIALKPLVDARMRYEHVDQDAIARDADAVTIRLRAGLSATDGPFSALVEGQGTLAIVSHYYDGVNGTATRPIVADPQDIGLYRAQLQYKSKALTLTVGRQRLLLDDERFVGGVNFRQNGQTFDAVRAEWIVIPKLKADVSYVWGVRTIWGIDGVGARPQSVSGNTVLANLSYQTPVGTVTGFAYLVDQNEAAVQGFRLSSQTYGARLAGRYAFSKAIKLSYQASFARQSDYHNNPNSYQADYYLIDAMMDLHALKIGGGYEVLAVDKGLALTSFQTPLGTLFKFQGWADKFLTTPPNGIRDLYGTAGYGWKKIGKVDVLTLQGTYHHFESDRLSQHYGNEVDLLASAKVGRKTISARYANYDADRFGRDTRKAWVQLDWAL